MIRVVSAPTLAAAILAGFLTATPAAAQMSDESDLVVRLNQLESQMRRLTGDLEQLQFRNQQLEQQLKRMTEDYEFRFQELGRGGRAGAGAVPPAPGRRGEAAPPPAAPPAPTQQAYAGGGGNPGAGPGADEPPPAPQSSYGQQAYAPPPAPNGRRSDAFDPSQRPGAPGAPRVLGSVAGESTPAPGRQPGAPLDLTSMAGAAATDPSLAGRLPAPPARNPNATGAQMATLPPGGTPKDEYDLGYGYVLRKDFPAAEQTFRGFLQKYPNDRLAADAQFWLGEALFAQRSYKDAADAYLTVTQRFAKSGKAPDALLRLGMTLAALNQKELACSSFAEIARKYPQASVTVKQAVEREQKRVHC